MLSTLIRANTRALGGDDDLDDDALFSALHSIAALDDALSLYYIAVFPLNVNSTFSNKFPFSNAAATRSLSWSCLFTCASEACEPLETFTSTLNLFW